MLFKTKKIYTILIIFKPNWDVMSGLNRELLTKEKKIIGNPGIEKGIGDKNK